MTIPSSRYMKCVPSQTYVVRISKFQVDPKPTYRPISALVTIMSWCWMITSHDNFSFPIYEWWNATLLRPVFFKAQNLILISIWPAGRYPHWSQSYRGAGWSDQCWTSPQSPSQRRSCCRCKSDFTIYNRFEFLIKGIIFTCIQWRVEIQGCPWCGLPLILNKWQRLGTWLCSVIW